MFCSCFAEEKVKHRSAHEERGLALSFEKIDALACCNKHGFSSRDFLPVIPSGKVRETVALSLDDQPDFKEFVHCSRYNIKACEEREHNLSSYLCRQYFINS